MLSFQFLHKSATMFICLSNVHIVTCYRMIITNYNYFNGLPGFSFTHVTVNVGSHRNSKAKYIVEFSCFWKKKNKNRFFKNAKSKGQFLNKMVPNRKKILFCWTFVKMLRMRALPLSVSSKTDYFKSIVMLVKGSFFKHSIISPLPVFHRRGL